MSAFLNIIDLLPSNLIIMTMPVEGASFNIRQHSDHIGPLKCFDHAIRLVFISTARPMIELLGFFYHSALTPNPFQRLLKVD